MKRECRYVDRFGGSCTSVDSEDSPAVLAIVAAAIASAAAVASILLKMLWGLALRSQVGWGIGVDDVVLVIFAGLLSSRGCIT